MGICLPLAAFLLHAAWDAADGDAGEFVSRLRHRVHDLRLPVLLGTAAVVALPWYLAVTLRTRGAWLEGFQIGRAHV